ncbi:hypothetical protein, partial [uncultured Sphingomonas sp.]|uniref:hypothetical protein n=1 Tax=uncultured Sphingomonas sp. TaxID=158754 RepID=UPI0035CA48CD
EIAVITPAKLHHAVGHDRSFYRLQDRISGVARLLADTVRHIYTRSVSSGQGREEPVSLLVKDGSKP